MKDRWILIDCDGLAHRAWHAIKDMENSVIYSILRDISTFQELFNTGKVVFCFDHGEPKRKQMFPEYKANRDRTGKQSLYSQLKLLKEQILYDCGFQNVLFDDGWEADDHIGFLTKQLTEGTDQRRVIIVSRDHDMHQLLSPFVRIYDPQIKSDYTVADFTVNWQGISPNRYVELLAWTGCKTDNIPGCPGVGTETVIKIIKGDQVSPRIKGNMLKFADDGDLGRNALLMELPYRSLPRQPLCLNVDHVTQDKWNKVCRMYNMESLVARRPRT